LIEHFKHSESGSPELNVEDTVKKYKFKLFNLIMQLIYGILLIIATMHSDNFILKWAASNPTVKNMIDNNSIFVLIK
ncbi:hypothetical protein, partial [Providencia rustigianii]|uniref:hypothetical protein n=1 Tax=Providencia rustigianii TaxID=158850 RepID=UPI00223F0CF0